mmetsp:Transcript_9830/g.27808  ORF Transcript_9830/g.27808 Transcript_9830/m.27808 type:complete len:161 (-) Transcript_9830:25-507(-)
MPSGTVVWQQFFHLFVFGNGRNHRRTRWWRHVTGILQRPTARRDAFTIVCRHSFELLNRPITHCCIVRMNLMLLLLLVGRDESQNSSATNTKIDNGRPWIIGSKNRRLIVQAVDPKHFIENTTAWHTKPNPYNTKRHKRNKGGHIHTYRRRTNNVSETVN